MVPRAPVMFTLVDISRTLKTQKRMNSLHNSSSVLNMDTSWHTTTHEHMRSFWILLYHVFQTLRIFVRFIGYVCIAWTIYLQIFKVIPNN